MDNYSDQQLIKRYLNGDEKSLEILFERYLKPIYSFVYRYAGARDAADITQDTFVKVWKNLKKSALSLSKGFDPKKGSFKTWIFAIARNSAIDFFKKKRPMLFSEFGENEDGESVITSTFADPAPLPLEVLECHEAGHKLKEAMKKLLPKYREVLLLRYNDHFTFREIAETLNEPLHTVKSRHRRAIIKLRNFLENPYKN